MADRHCTCARCGAGFVTTDRRKTYCTPKCKRAAWASANPARIKELSAKYAIQKVCAVKSGYCLHCGKPYSKPHRHGYCSTSCQRAAHRQRENLKARERYASCNGTEKNCLSCGKQFEPEFTGGKRSDYCSESCKAVVHAANEKRNRKTAKALRRARSKGADSERVDPFRVFERDGWRCQLCGIKTPKNKRGSLSADAPELDHIVPLSKGGAHTYANTQCACRRCNNEKSDKPLGQLLLIG